MVQEVVTRFQYFSFEFREIHHKALVIEFFGVKAHFKLPGVSVNVNTMSPVSTNVVGEINIDAFVNSIHFQQRLLAVDRKKQLENKCSAKLWRLIRYKGVQIGHMDQ